VKLPFIAESYDSYLPQKAALVDRGLGEAWSRMVSMQPNE